MHHRSCRRGPFCQSVECHSRKAQKKEIFRCCYNQELERLFPTVPFSFRACLFTLSLSLSLSLDLTFLSQQDGRPVALTSDKSFYLFSAYLGLERGEGTHRPLTQRAENEIDALSKERSVCTAKFEWKKRSPQGGKRVCFFQVEVWLVKL